MQIVNLNNHIVRKALCLSLNEMAVLCDIKQMSQNPEYGYTCIKSKDKIAEWLDLSRATVFNAIKALETRGYIERTDKGVRCTKFIYDLDMCQEEIGLYIQKGDLIFITKKVEQLLDGQSKNYTTTVQNLDGDSLKFRLPPSKIYTQDIHIDKHIDKHIDIKEIKIELQEKIQAIIGRINEHAGTSFRAETRETSKLISARLKTYSLEEALRVVDAMAVKWLKTDMKQYYTPVTLFRESNFEKYLQHANTTTTQHGEHVNSTDYKWGKMRYRTQSEFGSYTQYLKNCNEYGHTPKQEGHD
jgi:uncharacterized phage protein (TIGR02220 family)